MPNWCQTRMQIACQNTVIAEDLLAKIKDWVSSEKMETDFGRNWLGNIVLGAKIGTIDEGKDTDIECRGWLDDVYTDGSTVEVWTLTAWTPKMRMWKLIVDKYAPGAKITYEAVEDGCVVHWTNNPQLVGCYYFVNEFECESDVTEEALREYLQTSLNTDESDLGKLISDFEEIGIGFVCKWNMIPLDELCREEEQNALAHS